MGFRINLYKSKFPPQKHWRQSLYLHPCLPRGAGRLRTAAYVFFASLIGTSELKIASANSTWLVGKCPHSQRENHVTGGYHVTRSVIDLWFVGLSCCWRLPKESRFAFAFCDVESYWPYLRTAWAHIQCSAAFIWNLNACAMLRIDGYTHNMSIDTEVPTNHLRMMVHWRNNQLV